MKFVSLFDGVYGFGLGLEAAGMECVCRVEIDKFCGRVTNGWRPGCKHKRDVRRTSGTRFAGVGLVCGGFPCQDLSVAGKRKGLAGKRSGLFHELVRIVAEARPRWLLWENVPGLLSSNDGRDFWTVNAALAEIGYFGAWRVLDSQHFGVAQRRRRVFGLYAPGDSGARRSAAVLLEPDGGGWHPAAGRKAGEGTGASPDGGADGAGCGGQGGVVPLGIDGSGIGHSLTAAKSGMRFDPTEQDLVPCLRSNPYDDSDAKYGAQKLVCMTQDNCGRVRLTDGGGEITGAIRANAGAGRENYIANTISASAGHHGHSSPRGDGQDNLVSNTLTAYMDPNTGSMNEQRCRQLVTVPQAPTWEDWIAKTGEYGGTREEYDRLYADELVPMAFCERTHSGERNLETQENLSYALTNPGSGGRTNCSQILAPTLSTKNEVASSSTQREKWMEQSTELTGTVRRLTPTECEKLQGFPVGWTIPADQWTGWSLPKGLDSARYRALGNAVTTNVVYWIGLRIMHVERLMAEMGLAE